MKELPVNIYSGEENIVKLCKEYHINYDIMKDLVNVPIRDVVLDIVKYTGLETKHIACFMNVRHRTLMYWCRPDTEADNSDLVKVRKHAIVLISEFCDYNGIPQLSLCGWINQEMCRLGLENREIAHKYNVLENTVHGWRKNKPPNTKKLYRLIAMFKEESKRQEERNAMQVDMFKEEEDKPKAFIDTVVDALMEDPKFRSSLHSYFMQHYEILKDKEANELAN